MTTDGRRYRVLGVLGRGGFGTVYRAEMMGEGGFRRQVALKMLNSDMQAMPEVAQRLRDEARLLGMLRHRAILQGDGLVVLDDRWTVVMEYIDGIDLQVLGRKHAVPAGCALEIVSEVASALHVAYSQPTENGEPLKLIHRDIKPSNILLTAIGETKVLDFGIARANFAGREATTKGMRFGSPGYMAPERLDFEEGPAGDVYALGVLIAELVGGDAFGHSSVRPDRHQSLIDAAAGKMRTHGATEEVVAFMAEMAAYEPSRRPVARDVERRCRELRGRLPAPWLRDWAEEVVPPILNLRGLGSIHDLSHSVLVERSGGTTSATIAFEDPRSADNASEVQAWVDGPEVTEPARSRPTYSDEDLTPAPKPSVAADPVIPVAMVQPLPAGGDAAVPPPRVKRADAVATMPRADIPPVRPAATSPASPVKPSPLSGPSPMASTKPTQVADIPPPKPKVDANPTPAPMRSREAWEIPTAKGDPARSKTETRDGPKAKTETPAALEPLTEPREKRPRSPAKGQASSVATWMGIAIVVLVLLCVVLGVVAVAICGLLYGM